MATTVSKTTFTSRIVESITINGQQQQVHTLLSIPEVTDYSHRIMSVATSATNLLTLAAADAPSESVSARAHEAPSRKY